jgi:hypothetical protein
VHHELVQIGNDLAEPTESDLQIMRLSAMTRTLRHRDYQVHRSPWRRAGSFFRAEPAISAMAVAAVTVLVVGAGLVGRSSAPPARLDDTALLRAIKEQAATGAGMAGYWDAPFVYSNVSARPLGDGKLALSFDVSRHVDLEAEQASDVARDVLLHAILASSPMGARLKAMGIAQQITDERLREAVVFAMHRDPNLAVRLEALTVLTRYPFDVSVQDALLTTLRQDESVQMRLRALEYLTTQKVSSEALRRTIGEAGLASDNAIRQRAVELMQQL